MKTTDFYGRAKTLGHSADSLAAGNKITSMISVTNIEELRRLLDLGESDEEKQARHNGLFANVALTDSNDNSADAVLKRVNAHLVGNAPLSDDDRAFIEPAFPVTVMAESAADVTYTVPTSLGTSQLLITLNYGTVTIEDQACVNVYNSTLSYTMDTLVRNGNPPAGQGDFNVLGLTGTTGGVGGTGATGGNGSTGSDGYCSSAGIAGPGGQNGTAGTGGSAGATGGTGGNGLPSMPATITITQGITSTNNIIVYTATGSGGPGGTGGTGGTGGNGGGGGNGVSCGCTGNGAGNGITGSNGGNGGTGGAGGNGTNASGNTIVYAPSSLLSKITGVSAAPAGPGNGGSGGAGGAGGSGGSGGSGGKHNNDGSTAGGGGSGNTGGTGAAGTASGTAGVVNKMPV